MKRFLLIAMLLFINSILTLYAQEWVSVGDATGTRQSPSIEILRSDDKQYKIRVTIYGYEKNTITENNTAYSQIDIPDWQQWGKVGEPALPVLTQFIGIPANHEYTISVSDTIWETHSIGKIYPSQELRTENDTTEIPFYINDSVYNATTLFAERFISGEIGCIGGMYGLPISIIPFRYYPNRNEMDILKSFMVTVDFLQSSTINGNLSIRNGKFLKNIVDNYNEALINTYTIPRNDTISLNRYDYLIITADKYKDTDALKTFCAWKKIKGHNCKVVSCSEIGSNAPTEIKGCINVWYGKGVKYVLFVGNHSDIPLYAYERNYNLTDDTIYSDYWYGIIKEYDENSNSNIETNIEAKPPIQDDYYADLSIGRFPVNDIEDLKSMVNKTIDYENLTPKDTWVTKNLLIAHKEKNDSNKIIKYQACCEEIRTASYKNAPCFTTAYGAHDSDGGNNATNETVVSYINEGYGIVNYRGHGVPTGWSGDWNYNFLDFDYNYVERLSNKIGTVVFSIACQTGNLAINNEIPPPVDENYIETYSGGTFYNNSLMYNFMSSKNGAIAFLGATIDTETKDNDLFNKEIYNLLYNDSEYVYGYLNISARTNAINKGNSFFSKIDALAYVCGGDPSLEIWTDTISKFPDINITYQNGDVNINTKSIENYTVTLFSPVDSNYFERFEVEGTSFTRHDVPQNFIISLNKHNYMPLVYYVSDGDVYIQNVNYALTRNIIGDNVYVGSDVTDVKPKGGVTIKSDAKLHIKSLGKTILKKGVVVEQGANLYINK